MSIESQSLDRLLLDTLPEIFGTIDPSELAELCEHLEWISLESGEVLCQEGEPGNAMYILLRGRLLALPSDPDQPAHREIVPGETVGEWALVTEGVRSATVVAARSSVLVQLTLEHFRVLSTTHIRFMHHLASSVVHRFREAMTKDTSKPAISAPSGVYVVVRLVDDEESERFVGDLARSLRRLGPVKRLGSSDTVGALGVDSSKEDASNVGRIERWLDDEEANSKLLLLDVRRPDDAWFRRCIDRADHVVLVASSRASPRRRSWESAIYSGDLRLRAVSSLVLIHPQETTLPSGTSRWLDIRELSSHYHARVDHEGDLQRIARLLTGRGVGFVLAGGAALGAAHLGVLAALMERGVPIDFVGGTSSGGGIAGTIARFASFEEIHDTVVRAFVKSNPFSKPTLPILGVVSRAVVDATAHVMSGDVDIEDLWLPMFSISSNLSTGQVCIHRRGPLWKATRATTAVPGLVPPMIDNGEVLVDGGVLDNFPVRTMSKLCGGPVIGSDLLAPRTSNIGGGYEDLPGPRSTLLNQLGLSRQRKRLPTIPYVLFRTATIGSKVNHVEQVKACAIYLRPALRGISQTDFPAFGEIAQLGYEHAHEVLRQSDLSELIPGWGPGRMSSYVPPDATIGKVCNRFGTLSNAQKKSRILGSDRIFMLTQKLSINKLESLHDRLASEHKKTLEPPPRRLQPKRGATFMRRLFAISGSYHEQHLKHCEYGYKDLPTLLLFKLRGAAYLHDRPFTDENDWRQLYQQLHSQQPDSLPFRSEDPRCAEWMASSGYGVLLLQSDGDHLVVDTRELGPFVREGDDRLEIQARFAQREGALKLVELRHGDEHYKRFDDPSPRLRRSLRAITTAMFTVVTLRLHMSYCHFEVGDRYATFAAEHIPHNHPLRRMLCFTEYEAMPGSDQAVLTLIDYAFPAFTNLNREGLKSYLEWGRRQFNLLHCFHLPTHLVQSGITTADDPLAVPDALPLLQIAAKWWCVIEAYIRDYVTLYYPSDARVDPDTKLWLHRFGAMFGCPCPDSNIVDFIVKFGAAIAFSPIIHRICFNTQCMHPNPFHFSTRLRLNLRGPAALEWRREWMLRASAGGSATLPSINYTTDLTGLGLSDDARALTRRLSDDVRKLGDEIQARWPGHSILTPEQTPCSSRW